MAVLKCNYFQKVGCDALVHDAKATRSVWLSHNGGGLMNVHCCDECYGIINQIDSVVSESAINEKKDSPS